MPVIITPDNFYSLCRTCLNEMSDTNSLCIGKLADILSICDFIQVNVRKQISSWSLSTHNFKVHDEEYLPNKICKECQDIIFQIYYFKLKCDNAQKLLQQYHEALCAKSEDNTLINEPTDEELPPTRNKDLDEFYCQYCNATFFGKITRTVVSKWFSVIICIDWFILDSKIFKSHLKIHENKSPPKENGAKETELTSFLKDGSSTSLPFPCSKCSQAFSAKFDLKLHESTHVENKEFTCSSCKKQFASEFLLKHI